MPRIEDHTAHASGAGGLMLQTAWDVWILVALVAAAGLYAGGVTRLWRRAGVGQGIRRGQVAAFAMGWLALLAALVSPLDGLSDLLFAAHMTQHELLMLVAAPLIVLARPIVALVWLLPATARRSVRSVQPSWVRRGWRQLTGPVAVLLLHGVVIWAWHLPALFEAALASQPVHALQHLMFFWTAALFWWALMHGRYGRLGYGVAVIFVFVTAVHTSVLGALLTFAPLAWYPTYAVTAPAMGMSALEDQQLAGLLMWVPSGVIFMLVALALFVAWLGEIERRAGLRADAAHSAEGHVS
jgi:putative membrane protein